MAADNSEPERVNISSEAAFDLAMTFLQTAETWDIEQAERYDDFLHETFARLVDTPHIGRPIAGRPELRSYIAKWKRARHGHRIVYRVTGSGLDIVRVLHTAMNWQDHL